MTSIQYFFFALMAVVIFIVVWTAFRLREFQLSINNRLDSLIISSTGEANAAGAERDRNRMERRFAEYREIERSEDEFHTVKPPNK